MIDWTTVFLLFITISIIIYLCSTCRNENRVKAMMEEFTQMEMIKEKKESTSSSSIMGNIMNLFKMNEPESFIISSHLDEGFSQRDYDDDRRRRDDNDDRRRRDDDDDTLQDTSGNIHSDDNRDKVCDTYYDNSGNCVKTPFSLHSGSYKDRDLNDGKHKISDFWDLFNIFSFYNDDYITKGLASVRQNIGGAVQTHVDHSSNKNGQNELDRRDGLASQIASRGIGLNPISISKPQYPNTSIPTLDMTNPLEIKKMDETNGYGWKTGEPVGRNVTGGNNMPLIDVWGHFNKSSNPIPKVDRDDGMPIPILADFSSFSKSR